MGVDHAQLQRAVGTRYRIEEEIGHGGMARVYRACDLKLRRDVAIKVLHPEIAETVGRDRFLLEIDFVAKLTHPNILPLHDSGEADGIFYYVMPLIVGESLRDRLERDGEIPADEAFRIATEVADALAYAHAQGIMHRDIKPENILLGSGHAVVADFGIARSLDRASAAGITDVGVRVGTPSYMSPEALSPEALSAEENVDARSDIYSLGCVLYEMLLGLAPPTVTPKTPSRGATPITVPRRTLPRSLERIVLRALARHPDDRYQTAADFAAALRAFTTSDRTWRRVAIAAVAGIAVLVGWTLWPSASPPLDARKVVIYPLRVVGGGEAAPAAGQDVAIAMIYALNTTDQFQAVDGWRLLPDRDQPASDDITLDATRSRAHARYQVSGALMLGDSTRIAIEVGDLDADSSIHAMVVLGTDESVWRLGWTSARAILTALAAEETIGDSTFFSDRSLLATAKFFEGERAYRGGRFTDALTFFGDAVTADSEFTIAAVRAAQAASWVNEIDDSRSFIALALRDIERLDAPYRAFVRGIEAYLEGRADAAVEWIRRALELEPEWVDGWAALGETYTHLVPTPSDDREMWAAAFDSAYTIDSSFTPVLRHLLEVQIRRGEVALAARGLARYARAEADSTDVAKLGLMLRCVDAGPAKIAWQREVETDPWAVFYAASELTKGGLQQPECAEVAWHAVLEYFDQPGARWESLSALQSIYAGQGRPEAVAQLLDADTMFSEANKNDFHLLDAASGIDVSGRGDAWAARLLAQTDSGTQLSARRTWLLGAWAARTGRLPTAQRLEADLRARAATAADLPRRRESQLLAASLEARVALAEGDTARAERLLWALIPTADRQRITYLPWEALGWERLTLAELLLARGAAEDALTVAWSLDSPASISYAMHVPASLELRARIARRLGRDGLAEELDARQQRLGHRADPIERNAASTDADRTSH